MTAKLRVRTPIAVLAPDTPEVRGELDALEREGQPVVRITPPYRATLRDVVLTMLRRPSMHPKLAHLAATLAGKGVTHVHAWSDEAAAERIAALNGITFSTGFALRKLLERNDESEATRAVAAIDWQRLDARKLGIQWIAWRQDAIVAELALGNRNVIFKQHRDDADGRRSAATRAQFEHDILTRLHRLLMGPYGVPEPLLLDAPHGALVMAKANGTALDELVRAAKRDRGGFLGFLGVPRFLGGPTRGTPRNSEEPEDLIRPMRRAGAWLRAVQHITLAAADGQAILNTIVEQAVADAAKVGLRRVERRIRELAGAMATTPVTGHHGDYWPGNVFIGDGRAEVIDFEGWRDGFPLEDVAYFLQQLDLLFPRSRGKLPELQRAFCSGYFERDRIDRKALELFTMTKALRSLAHGAGAQHPLPLRLWIRSRLRGNVLSPLSGIGDRIANWR